MKRTARLWVRSWTIALLAGAVAASAAGQTAPPPSKAPATALPTGCLQEWQAALTSYVSRCRDMRPVAVTSDLARVVGREKAEAAEAFFDDLKGLVEECLANRRPGQDEASLVSEILTKGRQWVYRDGFAVGYFECYDASRFRARSQIQWSGVLFSDRAVEDRVNPTRHVPCDDRPAAFTPGNLGKDVVEQTPDGAYLAVSRFIVPVADGRPAVDYAFWWRLVFIPMRTECTHLTREQMAKVFGADLQAWLKADSATATEKAAGKP